MELIILKDKKLVEIEEYLTPKTINEEMNELKSILPYLIENIEMISFMKKAIRNGE